MQITLLFIVLHWVIHLQMVFLRSTSHRGYTLASNCQICSHIASPYKPQARGSKECQERSLQNRECSLGFWKSQNRRASPDCSLLRRCFSFWDLCEGSFSHECASRRDIAGRTSQRLALKWTFHLWLSFPSPFWTSRLQLCDIKMCLPFSA